MIILIFKVIFLFLAIYFSIMKIENAIDKIKGREKTARLLLQTIGIVGFVTLQFLL